MNEYNITKNAIEQRRKMYSYFLLVFTIILILTSIIYAIITTFYISKDQIEICVLKCKKNLCSGELHNIQCDYSNLLEEYCLDQCSKPLISLEDAIA